MHAAATYLNHGVDWQAAESHSAYEARICVALDGMRTQQARLPDLKREAHEITVRLLLRRHAALQRPIGRMPDHEPHDDALVALEPSISTHKRLSWHIFPWSI